MSDMLDRMERNLGNYAGVDALPPFSLFPWFFVIPGLLVAGLSGAALASRRRGRSTRGALIAVVIVGVGPGRGAGRLPDVHEGTERRRHDQRLPVVDDAREGHHRPGLLHHHRQR